MFILAIETTGSYGSVALLDGDGNVLGYEVSRDTMSHLKDLIPMVDTVLKKSGVSKNEINLIAPSVGPGSFTGIRIGVSTARALCQALRIRAVAVPTLEAFCFKESAPAAARCQEAGGSVTSAACDGAAACEAGDGGGSAASAVCAIINARRGQVYGMIDGFMKPGPYMLTDVLEVYKSKLQPCGRRMIFFGDGIDAYEKDIKEALGQPGPGYEFVPAKDRYQDAVSVGRWAAAHLRRHGIEDSTVDFENLLPDYMRRAEAEQKLESGQLPICKGPRQE